MTLIAFVDDPELEDLNDEDEESEPEDLGVDLDPEEIE